MTQYHLADLSFAELRDRLMSRVDNGDNADIDLVEVLRYFTALPVGSYTSDSADGLIQLARNFSFAAQPVEMLQAASLASRMALAADARPLHSRARNKEGFALAQMGRVAEATVAQAEAWLLARAVGEKKLEMFAIWGFSTICVAMGQWNVAIRYCERMRAMAEEIGLRQYESLARNNIADCAIQLRDPVSGFRALSTLTTQSSHAWIDARANTNLHTNLGHLYLLVGDIPTAKFHSEESARWATIFGHPHAVQLSEALSGLVSIRLGEVEQGLSAIKSALNFAKQTSQHEVPNFLAICVDAYEAAGDLDRALLYLQELVSWKRKSIDAEVLALQFEGLTESTPFQTGMFLFDENLVAKAHSLQAGVRSRVERLIEIALNGEIAAGHDLYRPFRVAKLARSFAASTGWDEPRIASLVLGAQLCNIGMISVPARVLLKPESLSEGESRILRDHARYGAELLRKAKLSALDVAGVIAEQHHEHYDGSGYPNGLSAKGISEEARIVAICDAFDAMTRQRPWRAALSRQAAIDELERGAGTRFDPQLVGVFIELFQREFAERDDLDVFLGEGADEFAYVRARNRMEAFLTTTQCVADKFIPRE